MRQSGGRGLGGGADMGTEEGAGGAGVGAWVAWGRAGASVGGGLLPRAGSSGSQRSAAAAAAAADQPGTGRQAAAAAAGGSEMAGVAALRCLAQGLGPLLPTTPPLSSFLPPSSLHPPLRVARRPKRGELSAAAAARAPRRTRDTSRQPGRAQSMEWQQQQSPGEYECQRRGHGAVRRRGRGSGVGHRW